jgi:hypothetical protein
MSRTCHLAAHMVRCASIAICLLAPVFRALTLPLPLRLLPARLLPGRPRSHLNSPPVVNYLARLIISRGPLAGRVRGPPSNRLDHLSMCPRVRLPKKACTCGHPSTVILLARTRSRAQTPAMQTRQCTRLSAWLVRTSAGLVIGPTIPRLHTHIPSSTFLEDGL